MKMYEINLEPDYNQDVTREFNQKLFHAKLQGEKWSRECLITTTSKSINNPLFIHEQWYKIGKHLNYFLINCDQNINHYIILN